MRQVVEHLQALDHDVMRALALDIDNEPDAARVMLMGRIVKALLFRNASIVMHHDTRLESGGADFAEACRWPPAVGGLVRVAVGMHRDQTALCMRRSTTIVSVRATPSIERIALMSRSSDEVFSVLIFIMSVCSPVT